MKKVILFFLLGIATTVPLLAQDIAVSALGESIGSGSTEPSEINGTDLGVGYISDSTALHASQTYTISNQEATTLTVSTIQLTGADAGDFSISGIDLPVDIGMGMSETFTITFAPTSAYSGGGDATPVDTLREAVVDIASNDPTDSHFTFAIEGYAAGEATVFVELTINSSDYTDLHGEESFDSLAHYSPDREGNISNSNEDGSGDNLGLRSHGDTDQGVITISPLGILPNQRWYFYYDDNSVAGYPVRNLSGYAGLGTTMITGVGSNPVTIENAGLDGPYTDYLFYVDRAGQPDTNFPTQFTNIDIPSEYYADTVLLDTKIQLSDGDLDSLNGGAGVYVGTRLEISRTGGAHPEDYFDFVGGTLLSVRNDSIFTGSYYIGKYDHSGHQITIEFEGSNQAVVSREMINDIIHGVRYHNESGQFDSALRFTYTFYDGEENQTAEKLLKPNSRNIFYVNENASGNDDGSSWANAFTDLQDALLLANAGDQIWMASGTYYPTNTDDRSASFIVSSGISIYGSLPVGATRVQQQDTARYPTILSGDIGTPGEEADNSYTVVRFGLLDQNTRLSGLTIQDGNASGGNRLSSEYGGGVFINNSLEGSDAVVFFEQMQFRNNKAIIDGGGILSFIPLRLSNCFFKNNYAGRDGGGLATTRTIHIIECTFLENSVVDDGGVMCIDISEALPSDTVRILGSNFLDNYCDDDGSAIFFDVDASSPWAPVLWFERCIIQGNESDEDGTIYIDEDRDDTLYVTMINSLVAGNWVEDDGAVFDLNGYTKFTSINNSFIGNYAADDGAVLEMGSSSNVEVWVYNNIWYGNDADDLGDGIRDGTGGQVFVYNSFIEEGTESRWSPDADEMVNVYTEEDFEDIGLLDFSFEADDDTPTLEGDFRLSEDSPLRNLGDNRFLSHANLDLYGKDRVWDDTVDLGAYETIPYITPSCRSQVNVTLDAYGQFELQPNQVASANYFLTGTSVIVSDDNPGNGNIIDCPGLYRYGLFDPEGELICWGEVLAEDKTGPVIDSFQQKMDVIECVYIDDLENNENSIDPNHPLYIGQVFFSDNCGGDCDCEVERKFFDRVEYLDCPESADWGDAYPFAELHRKFTATDCEGNQTDTTLVYTLFRPDLDTLNMGDDVNQQVCELGDDRDCRRPYWIGCFNLDGEDGKDRIYLDEIECNYSLTVETEEFPICGGKGVKIECRYKVFDWCAEESDYLFGGEPQITKIGDFLAPVFENNATTIPEVTPTDESSNFGIEAYRSVSFDSAKATVISTGPVDCTAAFSLELDALKERFGFDIDDCEIADYSVDIFRWGPEIKYGIATGDTIWRETNFPMINGNMAAGIPVGVYALVIEAFDGCYNSAEGVVYFIVKDQIAPVMKCDDDLNVTLSTGGYAKVYAADIDEGSWDNCELDELEVRRSVPQACIDSGDFDMDDLVEENGEFFTDWAEYVEFFCCDLAADVKIELRGTDAAVDPLTHMEMPNRNICWMELTIEDKVAPVCTDLPTVMTFCDDPRLDSLAAFGTPAVPFSNCGNIVIEELDPMQDLDNCGFGDIIRRYQAVKNLGAENEQRSAICTQEIQVKERHDYWIKFPEDQDANCGDSVAINGVEYSEDACDLLAVSHQDERFSATQDPDACYKIFRTYRVINWCEYDGEAEPTIVSRDWDRWNGADCTDDYNVNPSQATDGSGSPDGDDVPGNTDIFVIVKRNLGDELPDTVYYDNDSDPTVRTTDNGDTDDPDTDIVETYWWKVISGDFDPTEEDYYEGPSACGTNSVWANDGNQFDSDITGNAQGDDTDERYGSFGYWQYTQHIVVYDNVDPEVTVSGPDTFCSISNVDCAGPVEFEIVATDLCTDDDADVTVTVGLDVGNNGTVDADVTENLEGTTFTARYPIGEHRLVITANDGCGNFRSIFKTFVVEDCKKPAPICINGLSIELMPSEEDSTGAAMGVWASDFLASPIYDCNGQDDTDTDENGNPRVTKFSINKVGEPVDEDQTGVIYNCNDAGQLREVEIHAWDTEGNHDFCLTTVQVDDNMGMCTTPEGEGQITGAIATEEALPVPGVEVQLSGAHSLMYRTDEMGGYAFNGLKEDFDFTVTPHLDRNPLNGVSTFDLVLISKHILGVQPLNSPYKMIAADVNNSKSVTTLDLIQLRKLILNIDTEFSNNTSWRFVDASYNFNNPANPLAESFPEVKNINNLNGAELADFVAIKVGDVNGNANVAEVRSLAGTFALNVAEQELKAGNEYTIDVTADDLADVAGYQFTLNVANAEIVDLVYGIASEEHFGVFAKEGVITTSWNGEAGEGVLFSVVVRATEDTKVSDVLSISSRYTAAEAYNTNDELLGVALNIDGAVAEASNELFQNNPNPFKGETVIGFNLIDATEATITVQDVAGRILKVVEGDFAKGYNQVRLSATDLPSTGVFYYTLQAGDFTATKKMIIVE